MKTYGQRRSQLQERRIAQDTGGRVQPASGALSGAKSDVRLTGQLRIEAKTTSKNSFILKLEDLKKIMLEALSGGVEHWVFQVEFQRSQGQNKKIAILHEAVWRDWAGASAQSNYAVKGKSYTIKPEDVLNGPRSLLWDDQYLTHHFIMVPWYAFLDRWESQRES